MQLIPWLILASLFSFGLGAFLFHRRGRAESDRLAERIKALDNEVLAQRDELIRVRATLGQVELSKEETRAILETRKNDLERHLRDVEKERLELANRVAAFEEAAEASQANYDRQVTQITFLIQTQQEKEKRAEKEKEEAALRQQEELKQSWSRHETSVEQKMKALCQKLYLEYVGKEAYPHKGAPDNCVRISGELLVFDCKSPQGDDLSNFPTYIRTQAEGAVKYAKGEEVAKDLYFVVPRNAVGCLETIFYDLGNYRVHVITPDALEPILIARQQVEGYELAGKLDPADRERICLVIGRMAHGLKRRIQVDQFFSEEYMKLLRETQTLPPDILEEATRMERTSKMNPPTARKAKPIEIAEIQEKAHDLKHRAQGLQIDPPSSVDVVEAIDPAKR